MNALHRSSKNNSKYKYTKQVKIRSKSWKNLGKQNVFSFTLRVANYMTNIQACEQEYINDTRAPRSWVYQTSPHWFSTTCNSTPYGILFYCCYLNYSGTMFLCFPRQFMCRDTNLERSYIWRLSLLYYYSNININFCFIFMFPNNRQNWKPGHTLVFKEKDLTGLVSTPLFGFSVTIDLAIKCF